MSSFEPLTEALLDLARALDPQQIPLTIGGGFGLYLKQDQLRRTGERTLLAELPAPRATNDIDLFLRVDVLASLEAMQFIAKTLGELEFKPAEEGRYFQWTRSLGEANEVRLDLLVGPLGEFRDQLKTDKPPRVRPRGKLLLHAHTTEEAIAIDTRSKPLGLKGRCTDGSEFATTVYLPQGFTYLLMKLFAFDDRKNDDKKDVGRHHAMDLYRIVAMMTEAEYDEALQLSREYSGDPRTERARRIISENFGSNTDLGMLRFREHQLFSNALQADDFAKTLADIFAAEK